MNPLRDTEIPRWLKLALLALVPLVVVSVALDHVTTGVMKERALSSAKAEAQSVVQGVFQPSSSAHGLGRLRASDQRSLRRTFVEVASRERVAGATLWSRGQRPLVTLREAGGRSPANPASVRAALAGTSNASTISSLRGPKLFQVYLPLREAGHARPAAAVQIDMRYPAIAASVAHDGGKVRIALAASLALIYGALLALLAMASTEKGRRSGKGQHDMHRDPLTGLPNRLLFNQLLERAVLGGRRKRSLTAVMVMDLDRFKEVNDTLGHYNGDLLLQRLAGRLRATMRDGDTIARLGGDEFAILMPDMHDRDAVRKAAERVMQTFEEPVVVGGIALQVQGSLGIALCPEHGKRADAVLHAADIAMYVAKEARSGFEFHTSQQSQNSPDRLALVAELRRGIEEGQLVVHYQPKADLRSRRVSGVEALVRWEHPTRGLLAPDKFVSLAEQTGLIRPLTYVVLETALRQCRAWRDDGFDLDVAVNLSVHNLMDLAFGDDLQRLLTESRLPPSALQLEITESMIMSDPDRAMSMLGRLKEMGATLAVDDFGTGYSSLAYLKELPVSVIKIDRSFVIPMLESEDDAAIVRSTIDLGRNLGLQVVAEGVESEGAWQQLASHGCDLAQGFHLSRPLAAPDLTGWLSAYVDLVQAPASAHAEGG